MRLLAVLAMVAAFVVLGGQPAQAQTYNAERARMIAENLRIQSLAARAACQASKPLPALPRSPVMNGVIVGKNPQGQGIAMLPPPGNLPTVSLPAQPGTPRLPALPVDAKRPPAPQPPQAASRPKAPLAQTAPKAPTAPAEKAGASTPAPPENYPRGEVVGDQAKKLYLAGQPVGEIRALKGKLKGELVNVDQNNLHIHIWPGNYFSKIAIPVEKGQYQIAHSTGKGWVISPEKTRKIPAGYEPVRIGD